jgi:hypothetical protein
LNALVAVEDDPVRRHDLLGNRRLGAAVTIAPRIEVAEALLAGLSVSASRLDPRWVTALRLPDEVVLDDELALHVVAHGPLPEQEKTRRRAA